MNIRFQYSLLLVLAAAVFCIWLPAGSLYSHPADMYFQSHVIHMHKTSIRMKWEVHPGPLQAGWLWNNADRNGDAAVGPDEAEQWVRSNIKYLVGMLNSNVPLTWRMESVCWPSSLNNLQAGNEKIYIFLSAVVPGDTGSRFRLQFHNRFQDWDSTYWYSVYGKKDVKFMPPLQQKGFLETKIVCEDTISAEKEGGKLLAYWDTGIPALPEGALSGSVSKRENLSSTGDTRSFSALADLLRKKSSSIGFFLSALCLAVVLGAMHALAPGHGKTVVAAYLVGSRGTSLHAILLGIIVTATHTGSVFLLGVFTLAASSYILPEKLYPVLEIISGLLILVLGGWLLYKRWGTWKSGVDSHHDHDHSHVHAHDHEHSHADHHHHHHIPPDAEVSWRSLVTLGISGGLVPCPSAIAVLLVAIALQRIALGLSIIIAFSLGLAAVLILIGIATVHGRRLLEKLNAFSMLTPVLPVVSAVIVIILGAGLVFSAVLRTTSSGQEEGADISMLNVIPAVKKLEKSRGTPEIFSPGTTRVVFLHRDKAGKRQLAVCGIKGEDLKILTHEELGVKDYVVIPERSEIIYSVNRRYGGGVLWRIDTEGKNLTRLIPPEKSVCGNFQVSPGGRLLLYERVGPVEETVSLAATSIWLLDMKDGKNTPLLRNNEIPALDPVWSSNAEWISYYSPWSAGIHIYSLHNNTVAFVSTVTASRAVWHPHRDIFLIKDYIETGNRFIMHIFCYDIASEKLTDLTHGTDIEDSSPAWSPDGKLIVTVRHRAGETSGNRLHLMKADGSGGRKIVRTEGTVCGSPVWSSDSGYLLYHQYTLKKDEKDPGIYFINIKTGKVEEVYHSGMRPSWL